MGTGAVYLRSGPCKMECNMFGEWIWVARGMWKLLYFKESLVTLCRVTPLFAALGHLLPQFVERQATIPSIVGRDRSTLKWRAVTTTIWDELLPLHSLKSNKYPNVPCYVLPHSNIEVRAFYFYPIRFRKSITFI